MAEHPITIDREDARTILDWWERLSEHGVPTYWGEPVDVWTPLEVERALDRLRDAADTRPITTETDGRPLELAELEQ